MHARVVLGVGKGVMFREVSSVQECPHRERERFHWFSISNMVLGVGKGVLTPSHPHTLSRGNIGALRLLIPRLPALCGVNDQKDDGFTALHLAALNNHLEASQALLLAVSQNYSFFPAPLSVCVIKYICSHTL